MQKGVIYVGFSNAWKDAKPVKAKDLVKKQENEAKKKQTGKSGTTFSDFETKGANK